MSETMGAEAMGPRTYSHWRRPKAAGFGKLSFGASMGFIGGMALTVVVQQAFGLVPAVGTAAVVLLTVWVTTVRDRFGVSLAERMKEMALHRRRVRRKENILRSGPLGRFRSRGRFEPPGIAQKTKLSEHVDSYDRPFALLTHGDGTLSVVMAAQPTGAGLLDESQVDAQVASWGQWLADLGGELGVVSAQVVVESSPDSGERLEREMASRMQPYAPLAAGMIMDRVVREYRQGAAELRAWLTLTFDPAAMGTRRKGEAAVREICSRLPGITSGLAGTGAGAVHLLRPTEISRLVRVAYDPASEPLFEEAARRGQALTVGWADSGPSGAVAEWDSYRHDSGLSRTWVVSTPPRGVVQAHVLRPVLDVNRDVARKRVTLLFRPLDAALAPDVVEKDLARAQARVDVAGRPTVRDQAELAVAERVANDEASGAGLVDFAILITATTMGTDLEDTSAATTAIAAASRLHIRPAYGAQDSAFALALPLGLRPTSQRI